MEEKVRMNTKEFIGGIIGAFTFYLTTKKEYKAQEVDDLLERSIS